MHLRHLKGLQLAAMIVVLTGCDGDNKIWIVVDLKMPNGKAAQMSFDDPSLADVDLQTCEQALKGDVPILMQEIDGMPETKGSQFISARCVQSDESPAPHNIWWFNRKLRCGGLPEKNFWNVSLRKSTLRDSSVRLCPLRSVDCRAPDCREAIPQNAPIFLLLFVAAIIT